MKRIFMAHYDRFFVGLALAAFVGSMVWAWQAQTDVRRIRALSVAVRLLNDEYKPASWRAAGQVGEAWAKPAANDGGNRWLYELFTPPVVFYDLKSASFTVIPPLDANGANLSFELELVNVTREPYRLQLIGYFGEPGAYTAVFSNPDRPGTLRAREGGRFEDLGIQLKYFSVTPLGAERQGASAGIKGVAHAELWDERAGAPVILDNLGQKFTDASVALVKFSTSDGPRKKVRAGDDFSDRGITFRIERIQFSPAEITVSRHRSGGTSNETRVLHPTNEVVITGNPRAREPPSLLPRPATGIVTTKNNIPPHEALSK